MARKLSQKKKPKAAPKRAPRPPADRIVKAWRPTLNFPAELEARCKKRVEEIPYKSFSDYCLGLVYYDLMVRRPHAHTKDLMALPPAARDAIFIDLCAAFDEGAQGKADPIYYDHLLKRRIDDAVRALGFSPP